MYGVYLCMWEQIEYYQTGLWHTSGLTDTSSLLVMIWLCISRVSSYRLGLCFICRCVVKKIKWRSLVIIILFYCLCFPAFVDPSLCTWMIRIALAFSLSWHNMWPLPSQSAWVCTRCVYSITESLFRISLSQLEYWWHFYIMYFHLLFFFFFLSFNI